MTFNNEKKVARAVLALCLMVVGNGTAISQEYWDSLEIFQIGKVQPHADIIPADSQWVISLNGEWSFRYYESPGDMRRPGRNESLWGWGKIAVPGNLELQGYGVPVYVNMKNEFPSNPPHVPRDMNPTGVYVKDFKLPETWQKRSIFLKIGAASSAVELWINDTFVGYSEDSKTPAEWEISKHITTGNNRITIVLHRFSNGSYLECQDMWRMSGITRDVTLYSLPTSHIEDYRVEASLDTTSYERGHLNVLVFTTGASEECTVELEMPELGIRSTDEVCFTELAQFDLDMGEVAPWTAESPNLYTMTLRLRDSEGQVLHEVSKKIGFRTVEIKNGLFCINGVPTLIKGVNRHEHNAKTGHVVSRQQMEHDVELMKANNINAVRTCHYPDDEYWYDLCDRYGLYVWDEANNESHAQGYGEGSLAKKTEWEEAIWYRVNNMVQRDRNHPSVVVWSLGNECGNGVCFENAYRHLKQSDTTRPVSYERAELDWNTDIVGIMYPGVDYLAWYGRTMDSLAAGLKIQNPKSKIQNTPRPYIMVEYCHAMGNSLGGLSDYWDTIKRYDYLQGGFIWDWQDQGLEIIKNEKLKIKSTTHNKPAIGLGGDFGQLFGIKDDGDFCANGITDSYGIPYPCMAEVKAVYGDTSRSETGSHKRLLTTDIPVTQPPHFIRNKDKIATTEKKRQLSLKGKDFELVIDKERGEIARYSLNGKTILQGLHLNLWRPPTQNDRADQNGAAAWEGLEKLKAENLTLTVEDLTHDALRYATKEIVMEYLLTSDNGDAMPVREIIEVADNGAFQVSVRLEASGAFRTLARVGLQGKLSSHFEQTNWHGYDVERYPDRRKAGVLGDHTVDNWRELDSRHAVPQEEGNREADRLTLTGQGLTLKIGIDKQTMFNFSQHEYDDTVMAAHDRWWKMPEPPRGYSILNIDSRVAGLGTATCGPGVREMYRLSGDTHYTFRFTFMADDEALDRMVALNKTPFKHNSKTDKTLQAAKKPSTVAGLASSAAPDGRYDKGFPGVLHDGRRGIAGNYGEGWTGWYGKDTLTLTITRKKDQPGRVTIGICHAPGDWVVLPTKVEVRQVGSRRWKSCKMIQRPTDEHSGRQRIVYFRDKMKGTEIEIRITHPGSLPLWHAYKGEKAWLMIDEIGID